jgi:hypothetical protein
MTRLHIDDARCRALFASRLQQSDTPTAETVAKAIKDIVRQLGIRGCAGQMAQEYCDHPEAAAERMRWARQLLNGAPAPQAKGLRRGQRPPEDHGESAQVQAISRLKARLGDVMQSSDVTGVVSGRQEGHGGLQGV